MLRASLLALSLAALPASALDLEKWADKQVQKVLEEGRQDQIKALSSKKAEERREAVRFFSGRRDAESIGYVTKALSDPDARVREAAADGLWGLEKDAEPARAQLIATLDDPDPNVVAQAAGALQALGMKEAELVAPRKRVLDAPNATTSSRFLVSRNLVGYEPSIKLLYPMLTYLEVHARGKDSDNVELAQKGLERLVKRSKDRDLIEPLRAEVLKAAPGQAVLVQTMGLYDPKPPRFAETLVAVLDSPQPGTRFQALDQMRYLTQERDVRVWAPRAADMLQDRDSSIRHRAVWALGSAGGLAASETDKVVAALGDKEDSVRRAAARALGEMGDANQAVPGANKARVAAAARPALTATMEKDPDKDVRSEAKDALAKLSASSSAAVATAPGDSSEAGGMAVLRARKVTFEPSSYYLALTEQDPALVRAFLDAGMSPKESLLEMGSPIRVMLFSSTACNSKVRPTKPETKEITKLLLDRGADVNLGDKFNNTALAEAASHGCDREMMRMLIKAGAKVNATNASGLTAFEMGLEDGNDGLEELIAAGYRLPAAKVKQYSEAYKRPAAQAMIKKAAAK